MKNPFYAGERQVKEDFVRPLGKGFGVYSESGKLLGKHPSKAEANAQLVAIEAAKARRGDCEGESLTKRSNGLLPISLSRSVQADIERDK